VALALEMNPDGKTDEHGVLVAATAVPFPYGPWPTGVITGTGTTVAVETVTLSSAAMELTPGVPLLDPALDPPLLDPVLAPLLDPELPLLDPVLAPS